MEMYGLVGSTAACHDISVGSSTDISQKFKMGDIQLANE
jgi:hypothetical protein